MEKIFSDELQQMRDEMNSLKSLLKEQQIVNEQLMRKAMATAYNKEQRNIWLVTAMGVGTMPVYVWLLPNIGFPTWFCVVTCAFLLAAIAHTVYSVRRYVSQDMMTADLMTVAQNIVAYKRFGNNWLKFSIPFLTAWLACFFYITGRHMESGHIAGMCYGGIVGGIIGGAAGIMHLCESRRRLNGILKQIDELKG